MAQNKYEIRKDYIDRIGKKLIEYQKKGYLIFSPENDLVKEIEQRGFSDSEFGLCVDHVIYYTYDKELDNGYYTPLSQLKKTMSGFKIIHPKHIININNLKNI